MSKHETIGFTLFGGVLTTVLSWVFARPEAFDLTFSQKCWCTVALFGLGSVSGWICCLWQPINEKIIRRIFDGPER